MTSNVSVDLRGVKRPFSEDHVGGVRELKTESMFDVATRMGWHIVDNRLDISSLSELTSRKGSSPSL